MSAPESSLAQKWHKRGQKCSLNVWILILAVLVIPTGANWPFKTRQAVPCFSVQNPQTDFKRSIVAWLETICTFVFFAEIGQVHPYRYGGGRRGTERGRHGWKETDRRKTQEWRKGRGNEDTKDKNGKKKRGQERNRDGEGRRGMAKDEDWEGHRGGSRRRDHDAATSRAEAAQASTQRTSTRLH